MQPSFNKIINDHDNNVQSLEIDLEHSNDISTATNNITMNESPSINDSVFDHEKINEDDGDDDEVTDISDIEHESDQSERDIIDIDTEDDEDEDEDDDDTVYLDKDIEIKNVLRSKGYRKLKKIATTDQGSVWRGISPKKYGKINVVIKIASKIHYQSPNDFDLNSEQENILKEIHILRKLNECKIEQNESIQNMICHIIDFIDNNATNNYMVILEDGGSDLFNFTKSIHSEISLGNISIDEWKKTVKIIAKKLINLIDWMHNEMSLCHLDISLENILISNIKWINYDINKKKLSPDFKLKLIDFGASKSFLNCNIDSKFKCNSIIGKPTYCSPQIYKLLTKKSTDSFDCRYADVWSFGVSLFIMCIGCPPWSVPDERKDPRFQQIVLYKNLNYLLNAWKRSHFMDDNMKDVLSKIFVMAENDRINTKDIIKHSWLC